jgi:hypothetical protein
MADDAVAQGDNRMATTALASGGRRRTWHSHLRVPRKAVSHPCADTTSKVRACLQTSNIRRARRAGRYKFRPENMMPLGSYFCRTALSRDRFEPKYRAVGVLASR